MMRPYQVGPLPAPAVLAQTAPGLAPEAPAPRQSLDVATSLGPEPEIRFDLPAAGPVEVKIFNVRGALVRTLLNDARAAGRQVLRWDGTDDRGTVAPSGVYFSKVQSGGLVETGKVVLVK